MTIYSASVSASTSDQILSTEPDAAEHPAPHLYLPVGFVAESAECGSGNAASVLTSDIAAMEMIRVTLPPEDMSACFHLLLHSVLCSPVHRVLCMTSVSPTLKPEPVSYQEPHPLARPRND